MNLLKELGRAYMQQRFYGSMFFDADKNVCYISEDNSQWTMPDAVPIIKLSGTVEKPKTERIQMPGDFFTDLSVFATPTLGWRMAAQGRYLAHYSKVTRSNHRGLAPNNITTYIAPSTQFLNTHGSISTEYYSRTSNVVQIIMRPEFVTLKDGIEAMNKGDLFSFCISPTLAIMPEVNNTKAIFFKTHKVGIVEEDGSINCKIPIVCKTLENTL
jgi:hypothetical protein